MVIVIRTSQVRAAARRQAVMRWGVASASAGGNQDALEEA
jgi:hypothetical protein